MRGTGCQWRLLHRFGCMAIDVGGLEVLEETPRNGKGIGRHIIDYRHANHPGR